MKKKIVCGLANNEEHAQHIVERLQENGFGNDIISVLYIDKRGVQQRSGKLIEKRSKAPEGATTGGVAGGIIGGSIGLLAGLGALMIPGAGPFIAAGPIMAALAGSAVGGSVGMLLGALIGLGIPEFEAKKYENKLKSGAVLVTVHPRTNEEIDEAMQILRQEGAQDITTTAEKASQQKRF